MKTEYRNYVIEPDPFGHNPFVFAHEDYDGPPNKRCGFAGSVEQARQFIDEIEDDLAERENLDRLEESP